MRGLRFVEGCIEQLSNFRMFLIVVEGHNYTAQPPLKKPMRLALSVKTLGSVYLTVTLPKLKEIIEKHVFFRLTGAAMAPDHKTVAGMPLEKIGV